MSITLYSALMNYRKKQQYLKKVFGSEYYTYHFEDVLNKQNPSEISSAREAFKEFLDNMEEDLF